MKAKRHPMVDFGLRLVKEKPLGTVGAFIVLVMFFVGIFADRIAPYGMNDINLQDSLLAPSPQYILGTDQLGRDLFSRIVYGARISMIVSLGATILSTFLSAIIGLVSGYIGGRFDLIVQRFVDAWMCFPGLVPILVVMSILGPGIWQVVVVLGVLAGIGGSRLVRSAVIGIKENVYVDAARATGSPTSRTIFRHILPNIMPPIIILYTTRMAGMILTEASLSFLGFGVPPPAPSWGGMLSGVARKYMLLDPWMVIWPGLALTIVVYGISMFGDAVRDLFDPRLRGGIGRYSGVKAKLEKLQRKKAKEEHE